MRTVAVFNFKGGTAKSTTTLNLGAYLAKKYSTGVVDLDGQRTLSFALGMDGVTPTALDWLMNRNIENLPIETQVKGLRLIPGDIGMFKLSAVKDIFTPALKALKPLDVYMMDCPPSLSVASVQAILAADRVLLPTLCEPAALRGLSEAIELIRGESADIPIDVLRTRHKPRLVLSREADQLLKEASEGMGFNLLKTTIPENIAIAESIAQQQPISVYAPESSGAKAYKTLAKEVTQLWRLGNGN